MLKKNRKYHHMNNSKMLETYEQISGEHICQILPQRNILKFVFLKQFFKEKAILLFYAA